MTGCLFVCISNGVNRYKVHMYMSCLQLCTKTTMATLFFLEVLFTLGSGLWTFMSNSFVQCFL